MAGSVRWNVKLVASWQAICPAVTCKRQGVGRTEERDGMGRGAATIFADGPLRKFFCSLSRSVIEE